MIHVARQGWMGQPLRATLTVYVRRRRLSSGNVVLTDYDILSGMRVSPHALPEYPPILYALPRVSPVDGLLSY